jgi:hypothetical protein
LFSGKQQKFEENREFLVRFEFLTSVTVKSAVFWVVGLNNSEKARSFGWTYHLHLQGMPNKTPAGAWLQAAVA